MKVFGARLTDWVWVLYPVIVVVVLFFGTNYLLSSGEMSLVQLSSQQEEIEAQQKVVTELRNKVAELKLVNREKGLADLQKLLEAMPASKKVWLTVRTMQDAASNSGTVIASYKGVVGDVTEASDSAVKVESLYNTPLSLNVEYEITNFDQLTTILSVLEKAQPLVKVRKVDFTANTVVVEFDAAWLAWKRITTDDVGTAVPNYEASLTAAMEKIAGLENKEIFKSVTQAQPDVPVVAPEVQDATDSADTTGAEGV